MCVRARACYIFCSGIEIVVVAFVQLGIQPKQIFGSNWQSFSFSTSQSIHRFCACDVNLFLLTICMIPQVASTCAQASWKLSCQVSVVNKL